MDQNLLFYGDNLEVLKRHVKDESVDLIYLDPPFNSNKDYNAFFETRDGRRSPAQLKAFGDTWRWDQSSVIAYQSVVEHGPTRVGQALRAMRTLFGDTDMLAYLSMMAPRLVELHRALKPDGTIYLHCDPTASHYLKMLMDSVFDGKNFLNEIAWCYDTGGRAKTAFPRKHDIILRYGKTRKVPFYYDAVALPRDFSTMHETVQTDDEGRQYQSNIKAGKEYRYYQETGVLPNDWWADIQALNPAAKERLGYPTQKPETLLERIIKASSKEGDTVLDPFCGCGTTISVAQRLNRRWIGIDITSMATTLIKNRLADAYGKAIVGTYKVIGEPTTVDEAAVLARTDEYQFQWWALGLVGARKEQKKGADKGIDGILPFHDDAESTETKTVIISVKAGQNIGPGMVRELSGTVTNNDAQIGALILMKTPTQAMRSAAASGGFYKSPWGTTHPRLQILTVEDILAGKKIDMPPSQDTRAFKKAPKAKKEKPDYNRLPLGFFGVLEDVDQDAVEVEVESLG